MKLISLFLLTFLFACAPPEIDVEKLVGRIRLECALPANSEGIIEGIVIECKVVIVDG